MIYLRLPLACISAKGIRPGNLRLDNGKDVLVQRIEQATMSAFGCEGLRTVRRCV
jgi:hypothetical protein